MPTPEPDEEPETITHRITVEIYTEGSDTPEIRVYPIAEGADYSIAVPEKPGYSADPEIITGTADGDRTVTVRYSPVYYRLKITYIYPDGSKAAETYQELLQYQAEYDVISPAVKDATPANERVTGRMEARNMEYTVIYLPNQEILMTEPEYENVREVLTKAVRFGFIEDYETPLGLGSVIMHVGVCFE